MSISATMFVKLFYLEGFVSSSKNFFVIVITFYSPSCFGQETAKGPYTVSSQAASCPTRLPRAMEASHQEWRTRGGYIPPII